MRSYRLVAPFLLVFMAVVGAGCVNSSPSPVANPQVMPSPSAAVNPPAAVSSPAPQAVPTSVIKPTIAVPADWLTINLKDLGISLQYPSAWGTASRPGSLKVVAGAFKTISFSAFSTQVASIDLYYYSSNYKPTTNTPNTPSLTTPTCESLASRFSKFGIGNCEVINASGKTAVLFEDKSDNSYKGWLYTGNKTYPVLEIAGTVGLDGADRDTFAQILGSAK